MKLKFIIFFLLLKALIYPAIINEKVLICGVCKDIENAIPNTINSIKKLGSQFLEYKVIIYENNSEDQTKKLLQKWADSDHHVIFLSETLSKKQLRSPLHNKKMKRTEKIARARNKVAELIVQKRFDDYKYVIWSDLDFTQPWDVENIVDSILNPEQAWDAIFANGCYDLYAYRSKKVPLGPELLGKTYWLHHDEIYQHLKLDRNQPWQRVYSAFGGLGIYKREAIKGCYYSGFVTKDLEKCVQKWLLEARDETILLKQYKEKLKSSKSITVKNSYRIKGHDSKNTGVRLDNSYGLGEIVWFSSSKKCLLPTTCEHVPFHASMIENGHDKLFINPRIRSIHPVHH